MRNHQASSTAVLIFANSSLEDVRHKPSLSNPDLFEALTAQAIKIAKQSGLPFFHIDEKQQNGNTFGERFSNAIESIYEKGYENVITIGNDSPQLSAKHLLLASRALNKGKTVLGPSTDGGFYLMGLNKTHFDAALFQNLPWQRLELFKKISSLFASYQSQIFTLPALRDIDKLEDVKTLIDSVRHLPIALFKILVTYLTRITRFFEVYFVLPKKRAFTFPNNKGSPIYLFVSQ